MEKVKCDKKMPQIATKSIVLLPIGSINKKLIIVPYKSSKLPINANKTANHFYI